MSVVQGTDISTIYVKLVDEGTEVWRPVSAIRRKDNIFVIASQSVPADEKWEFLPGDVVVVEDRLDANGSYAVCVRHEDQ
jgi:hypothetical protein